MSNKLSRELDALLASESALRASLAAVPRDALPAAAAAALAAPAPGTAALSLAVRRPRVGVGCVLLCDAQPGRVLVGERRGAHGAGRWALPGGHLEPMQSWGACASMELAEECGVELPEASWEYIAATNDLMRDEGLHYVVSCSRRKPRAPRAN